MLPFELHFHGGTATDADLQAMGAQLVVLLGDVAENFSVGWVRGAYCLHGDTKHLAPVIALAERVLPDSWSVEWRSGDPPVLNGRGEAGRRPIAKTKGDFFDPVARQKAADEDCVRRAPEIRKSRIRHGLIPPTQAEKEEWLKECCSDAERARVAEVTVVEG